MELILAIVVSSAVIFFGALISMGNERQRRAIDHLREQVVLWAVQDVKIKREGLARDIKVENPLAWLDKIASGVVGDELRLQVVEVADEPTVLVCRSQTQNAPILFCTLSPAEIRKRGHIKRDRFALQNNGHLHLLAKKRISAYEISMWNGGILFDIELPLAWSSLTGREIHQLDRLWMYLIG